MRRLQRILKIVAVCLLPALLLTGCWSYRSLSDISIVMGMGVDQDPATGKFQVTSEIIDLSKSLQNSAPGSKVVVAEGNTVFDAVRNAKKRLLNRLYLGNTQVLIIGEELARTVGISAAVDWFMRDGECRETVNVVIAQGTGAKELLSLEGSDQAIVALEMDRIIVEDHKATASTAYTELYQAYYTLTCKGIGLTLPAFHISYNGNMPSVEANGMAVFSDDKLVGYISPEDSKYVLIATGQCNGGLLTLSQGGSGMPDTTLEIQDCKTKTKHEVRGDQLVIKVQAEVNVFLAETMADINVLEKDEIKSLENTAAQMLESEVSRVIRMAQEELRSDVFGFGHMISQRDVRLWDQLEPSWKLMFPTLQVEVSCKVNIKNTAFIKSKEVVKQ